MGAAFGRVLSPVIGLASSPARCAGGAAWRRAPAPLLRSLLPQPETQISQDRFLTWTFSAQHRPPRGQKKGEKNSVLGSVWAEPAAGRVGTSRATRARGNRGVCEHRARGAHMSGQSGTPNVVLTGTCVTVHVPGGAGEVQGCAPGGQAPPQVAAGAQVLSRSVLGRKGPFGVCKRREIPPSSAEGTGPCPSYICPWDDFYTYMTIRPEAAPWGAGGGPRHPLTFQGFIGVLRAAPTTALPTPVPRSSSRVFQVRWSQVGPPHPKPTLGLRGGPSGAASPPLCLQLKSTTGTPGVLPPQPGLRSQCG